jgi:hypothetical protein
LWSEEGKMWNEETKFAYFETSAKRSIRRSGVSAERRILQENGSSGFLPKAATSVLQRSHFFRSQLISAFCILPSAFKHVANFHNSGNCRRHCNPFLVAA